MREGGWLEVQSKFHKQKEKIFFFKQGQKWGVVRAGSWQELHPAAGAGWGRGGQSLVAGSGFEVKNLERPSTVAAALSSRV